MIKADTVGRSFSSVDDPDPEENILYSSSGNNIEMSNLLTHRSRISKKSD